jgi:hypothetical protein
MQTTLPSLKLSEQEALEIIKSAMASFGILDITEIDDLSRYQSVLLSSAFKGSIGQANEEFKQLSGKQYPILTTNRGRI